MIGTKIRLKIEKILSFGYFLGKEEILLPKKYLSNEAKVGDDVEVFIYTDSEDRIIATTLQPYGVLNEIVCLDVVSVEKFGVFLDLGIAKDILMPTPDPKRFKIGQKVAIQIVQDKEGRLLATPNLKFQKYKGKPYVELEAVPYRKTPLGFECIVNKQYQGMLFGNEVFESIELGKAYRVQVKKTRQDGKIDLKLILSNVEDKLIEILHSNGGRLNITKESDPKVIVKHCQMSKKMFKKALNNLTQKIGQDHQGIYLKQ